MSIEGSKSYQSTGTQVWSWHHLDWKFRFGFYFYIHNLSPLDYPNPITILWNWLLKVRCQHYITQNRPILSFPEVYVSVKKSLTYLHPADHLKQDRSSRLHLHSYPYLYGPNWDIFESCDHDSHTKTTPCTPATWSDMCMKTLAVKYLGWPHLSCTTLTLRHRCLQALSWPTQELWSCILGHEDLACWPYNYSLALLSTPL